MKTIKVMTILWKTVLVR